ncbi:MAG: hypothetical protein AAB347_07785, partial [Bacteroidota bacterium]
MASLPRDTYLRCRKTLLRCPEFRSHASLKAIFVTEELKPFINKIRSADSSEQLVDLFLEDSLEYVNGDIPLLALLLVLLCKRHLAASPLHHDLSDCLSEVKAALNIAATFFTEVEEHAAQLDFFQPEYDHSKMLSQLTDPFIRKLEELLRMNNIYWTDQ